MDAQRINEFEKIDFSVKHFPFNIDQETTKVTYVKVTKFYFNLEESFISIKDETSSNKDFGYQSESNNSSCTESGNLSDTTISDESLKEVPEGQDDDNDGDESNQESNSRISIDEKADIIDNVSAQITKEKESIHEHRRISSSMNSAHEKDKVLQNKSEENAKSSARESKQVGMIQDKKEEEIRKSKTDGTSDNAKNVTRESKDKTVIDKQVKKLKKSKSFVKQFRSCLPMKRN